MKKEDKSLIDIQQRRIYLEQLRLLLAQAPVTMLATLINSLFLVFVLREVVDSAVLLSWVSVNLLLIVSRYIHPFSFPASTTGYGRYFKVGQMVHPGADGQRHSLGSGRHLPFSSRFHRVSSFRYPSDDRHGHRRHRFLRLGFKGLFRVRPAYHFSGHSQCLLAGRGITPGPWV